MNSQDNSSNEENSSENKELDDNPAEESDKNRDPKEEEVQVNRIEAVLFFFLLSDLFSSAVRYDFEMSFL